MAPRADAEAEEEAASGARIVAADRPGVVRVYWKKLGLCWTVCCISTGNFLTGGLETSPAGPCCMRCSSSNSRGSWLIEGPARLASGWPLRRRVAAAGC